MHLSSIVVADPQDAGIREMNELVQIEHGGIEVRDRPIFGVPIKRGYIITSLHPETPAAA